MIFATLLLLPGLMGLVLALGRYEEWLFGQPEQPAPQARRRRHLALVPAVEAGSQAAQGDREAGRRVADAA
jgi:hypothetical protein